MLAVSVSGSVRFLLLLNSPALVLFFAKNRLRREQTDAEEEGRERERSVSVCVCVCVCECVCV